MVRGISFTEPQREAYRAEQDRNSLVYGRVFAFIVATGPWYFLYQDLAILGFGRWVIGWLLLSIIPATIFLLLSFTYLRNHRRPVFWLHLVQECALIVAVCGYVFGIAGMEDADATNLPGAVGGLTICVVGTGALAGGTRRWLALILGVPIGALIVALRLGSDITPQKMALLANPVFIGFTMVLFGLVHERLLRREFGARWLADEQRVQLKDHDAQLAAVNKDLEHFAGVTSHELQQPLVTVNWWLGLACSQLGERGQLAGQVEKYLRNAESTVSNMNGLIARLLAYSELSEDELLRETVDLNTVFTRVVGDLGALIAGSEAAVTADKLPQVEADRYLLGEIFQNLVENAIKYAHPDRLPEVHVSAEERPHGWRVMVRDNGQGIDPVRVDTIFAPRARLRAGDSVQGTGLGLATCRKIVNLHGGTIGAVPSDSGSTFWFTLPRLQGG